MRHGKERRTVMVDGNKHSKPQQAAIIIGVLLVLVGVWNLFNAVLPGWLWGLLSSSVRML